MLCRHCHTRKVQRARGLCSPCYYTPAIRDRYPPKCVAKGPTASKAPLGEPTSAHPGSEEKIAIMMERASKGQSVFHPLDGPKLTEVNR